MGGMIVVQGDLLRIIVYMDGGDNDVSDSDAGLRDEGEGRYEVSRGVMVGLIVCD